MDLVRHFEARPLKRSRAPQDEGAGGLRRRRRATARGDRLNFARDAARLGVCPDPRCSARRAQAWHVDCSRRPTSLAARVPAPFRRGGWSESCRPGQAAGCTAGQKPGRPQPPGFGRSRRCSACFNACRGIAAHETPHRQPVRRRRIACDRHLRRRSRGEEGVQCRLVDLCRLDAVALCRRFRHRQEVGRQIRHHHQRHPDQRLRRIDQPVHGGQVRRGHRHQHGRAHHPRRRRRRFERHHHGRLLQRQ